MSLKRGDRVRYTGNYWTAQGKSDHFYPSNVGHEGIVTQVWDGGSINGTVEVDWDDKGQITCPSYSVYVGNVESVNTSKPEDPRTPETVYVDSVDDLLSTYAKRLHESADTMVYPYSHLGVLAEFLHAYRAIEKPASLGG